MWNSPACNDAGEMVDTSRSNNHTRFQNVNASKKHIFQRFEKIRRTQYVRDSIKTDSFLNNSKIIIPK